ncbi:hypothetical protein SAMN05444161_5623 [Rhizobiales bacterium GAS191]|nr:hypothetical protein SAMN05444161_5623 [Rhizobiales bacterium GAS191]
MNLVVFATLKGAMIAMLGLSTPVTANRSCIFVMHPLLNLETYRGPEGRVVLPDRPTEYPCFYASGRRGTVIEFENQNGWRFEVRLGRNEEGRWSARKGAEMVTGRAFGP